MPLLLTDRFSQIKFSWKLYLPQNPWNLHTVKTCAHMVFVFVLMYCAYTVEPVYYRYYLVQEKNVQIMWYEASGHLTCIRQPEDEAPEVTLAIFLLNPSRLFARNPVGYKKTLLNKFSLMFMCWSFVLHKLDNKGILRLIISRGGWTCLSFCFVVTESLVIAMWSQSWQDIDYY